MFGPASPRAPPHAALSVTPFLAMNPRALPRRASLRLTDDDFGATLPQAPTKARRSLEGRLFSWAAEAAAHLSERFGPLEVHAVRDPDGDGSGVVFVREGFARTTVEELAEDTRSLRTRMGEAPYLPHLHVALLVYLEAVELRIDLPARAWVDAENLRARLADPGGLLELLSSLESLPEVFELLCFPPGPSAAGALCAQRATADDLRALSERARAEPSSLRVRWRIPKRIVLSFPADLGDALEDALFALSSVTKLVAWAEDNDVLGLVTRWEARRERRLELPDEGGVPSERTARRPPREDDEPRPKRSYREPPSRRYGSVAAPPLEPERLPPLAPLARKIPRRARAPRLFDVDPAVPVERGTGVKVLAGPFAGRIGAVLELLGSDEAKVSLGLLVARVPIADLVACAPKSGRTRLPSSHRKPPAR